MTEKIKKALINWAVEAVFITSAFFLGLYFTDIKSVINPITKKMPAKKSLSECSVAITDRGELLIINRNHGIYEVFDESVGMTIFNSYATRITSNQPK